MWRDSKVTSKLGIRYPIIQGPFGGGLSTVDLVAAVSNAGGLGSFGMHHLPPEGIGAIIAQIRERTPAPFAVNLWVPLEGEAQQKLDDTAFQANLERIRPYLEDMGLPAPQMPDRFGQDFEAQLEAVLEARPPVLSFVFGTPSSDVMRELRQRGIRTIGAATTVEEALTLERSGVELIVASGSDAGGHRPSFLKPSEESLVGTFSLIPQIADAVGVPVIAAGGIGDARGIAAAFTLGASAVQIGTLFLACHESGASEAHKAQLVTAAADDTVLTRAFSGRLARGIRNRFTHEMSAHEAQLPEYPIQNWFLHSLRQEAAQRNRPEYLALWAGQGVRFGRRQSALECFQTLVTQTNQLLA